MKTTLHFASLVLFVILTLTTQTLKGGTLVNQLFAENTGTPHRLFNFVCGGKDADGNIIIAVNSISSIVGETIHIAKFDDTGTKLWERDYESDSLNYYLVISDMVLAGNDIYVTGAEAKSNDTSNFITMRLDQDGNEIWRKTYRGAHEGINAATTIYYHPDSAVIFVCGTEAVGYLDLEYTVIKYDSSGNEAWVSHYDSTGFIDVASGMVVFADQWIFMGGVSCNLTTNCDVTAAGFNFHTGAFQEAVRFGNAYGLLNNMIDISKNAQGEIYILGSVDSAGQTKARVIKMSPYMQFIWLEDWLAPGSISTEPKAMVVDPHTGMVAITATARKSNGGTDMVAAAFDTDSNLLWERSVSAPDPTRIAKGNDIAMDNDNNVYITGAIDNGTDLDYLVTGYTSAGEMRFMKTYNNCDSCNDEGSYIGATKENMMVGGISRGLSDTSYVTVGYKQADAFIPKDSLDPNSAYAFYENQGQIMVNDSTVADSVFYYTNAGNPQLYIGDSRLSYVIGHTNNNDSIPFTDTLYRIDMALMYTGAWEYTNVKVYHDAKTNAFLNYYQGNLPEAITGVEGSNRLVQKDVYNGVDWHVCSTNDGIKNYFVVRPRGNWEQIKINYYGADSSSTEGNALKLFTSIGTIQFDTLFAYEVDTDGTYSPVGIGFDSVGKSKYKFVVDSYGVDKQLMFGWSLGGPSAIEHLGNPEWSTPIGGIGYEEGTDVTTDLDGNPYMCGFTSSADFPISTGVVSGVFISNSGGFDAFISKFGSAKGASLHTVQDADRHLWSTYFGGSADDRALGIITTGNGSASGKVYITGVTMSSNLPVNVANNVGDYIQTTLQGTKDAFIFSVQSNNGSSTSSSNLWATYFGGDEEETGRSIGKDGSDNIYIVGSTNTTSYSADQCIVPTDHKFPSCSTFDNYSGGVDGFICSFNPAGELTGSSFFGGADDDFINDVVLDDGDLYFVGTTSSTSSITIPRSGAYNQSTIGGGGLSDVFLGRLNSLGTLDWSTYFGGNGKEEGFSITNDLDGNIYIGGSTGSLAPACTTCLCVVPTTGDFPLCKTGGAYFQGTGNTGIHGGGNSDGFIAEFNAGGSFIWGTYYGGNGDDRINGLATDFEKRLFFTGQTFSSTPPDNINETQPYPYYNQQYLNNPGSTNNQPSPDDAFVGYFDEANGRIWSSYYGGKFSEKSNAVATYSIDNDNRFWYITGTTNSLSSQTIDYPNFYIQAFHDNCCVGAYRQDPISGAVGGTQSDAYIARFSMNDMCCMNVENVSSTGLAVNVFPNPASQYLTAQFRLEQPENIEFEIFSVSGQHIKSIALGKQQGAFTYSINFGDLSNGTYLLQIKTTNHLVTKKIIKHE